MTRLVIDEQNELHEISARKDIHFPILLRITAKIISFIFHPLFIPVYISWFLVRVQSYLFSEITEWDKTLIIIRFLVMYALFPLVTVLLLKGLGFVSSIQLKTQRERIIPYVACGVYYFWMWYVLYNQSEFPSTIVSFTLAIFIGSSLGLLANIFMKVSMHSISAGVMATFIMILGFTQDINFGSYISIALLICGLVCTSRLIASDHSPGEIYIGLLIGIISQITGSVSM